MGNHLDFFIKLYNEKKLPKVIMLSGKKGIGKSTIINHFLNFVYDQNNYDLSNKIIKKNSQFNKQYLENSFSNIIYLSGSDFKKIKIEDIRSLKSKLLKSTIINKERFIILDDVELFNINSLNALLKLIEEPNIHNYFILINNQAKVLIKTICSRSLEFKISITNVARINIIESLINSNNLTVVLDYKLTNISPGNFMFFNDILKTHKLHIDEDYLFNIEKIFNLYKKNKNINFINLSLLLTDFYFYQLSTKKTQSIDRISSDKSFVISNINKFVIYNLNLNSLINALSTRLSNG